MPPGPPHHGFIPSTAEDLLRRRVKAELRKRMRGVRGAMPASTIAERSARIADGLTALPTFAGARAVALFWPMPSRREVDLRPLDATLRARGVRVAYPSLDSAGEMAFRFVSDADAMVDHALGFREPAPDAPAAAPGELDAVVVPALAVDPRGHRIGYGAGHYDRALPRFASQPQRIAVAFDFQLVAEVPDTIGDVPVGIVVTDRRTLVVGEFGAP
jgi:5-formyltetrahydrofolate cyclo-ligase